MKIAFVEIDNDLELYVFEVFASMKLSRMFHKPVELPLMRG
jgi:hypothetical protein